MGKTTTHYSQNIRETMRVLPAWLQPALTHITGKPLPYQQPLLNFSNATALVWDLVKLLVYPIVLMALLVDTPILGLLCLPVYYVLQVGLLRKMQIVYIHHIVHNAVFRRKIYNRFWGNLLVGVAMVQNMAEYSRNHHRHHKNKFFTTIEDDDAAFLRQLGFKPGKSRRYYWFLLFATMVSPYFHYLFIKMRIQSALFTAPLASRLTGGLMLLSWVIIGSLTSWQLVFTVFIMPWFFLYHISALLQFLTEHAWMVSGDGPITQQEYADRCWGRFCGEALVMRGNRAQRAKALSIWALKMLVFHIPYRYGCLSGDLPAHDWHHMCAMVSHSPKKWPEGIYMRQKAIDQGFSLGMEKREIWGLRAALTHSFSLLSAVPAADSINRLDARPV